MLFALACDAAAAAEANLVGLRGKNQLVEPGFERASGWTLIGPGARRDPATSHSGGFSLRCRGDSPESVAGARQTIVFDPPIRHPLRVSGWSKAERAEVFQDYNIYLDIHYADGTPLWGQMVGFSPGSHDWERAEQVFEMARPVRSIEVYVFFRKCKGTVWFDDIEVSLAPFAFDALELAADAYGPGSLALSGSTRLPARWKIELEGPGGLCGGAQGSQMPIAWDWCDPQGRPGEYTLRISATDALAGQTIRAERRFQSIRSAAPRRGLAVWTETSMKRVYPTTPPPAASIGSPPTAHVDLAGNEYESFQALLRNATCAELRGVRVETGDLVCVAHKGRIAARHVVAQPVGYLKVDVLQRHPAEPSASPGWWPELLLPIDRFNLPPGFTQAVWLTVYAPPGTPPGDYRGTVTVRPADGPAIEVPLTAHVFGFSLPAKGRLKTAFALMDGFLERLYGKPLSPELRRRYGRFLLEHRLNPDDISRTDPPDIGDLEDYRPRGLNAFNVLNMVEPRGERAWVCYSEKSAYTPQFKQRLFDRLEPYVAELRRRGLERLAYVYTFDERGEDFHPILREYFGEVKRRFPAIPTFTTAYVAQDPAKLRDLNIDWICPLTAAYRYEEAERCRAAGRQVWAYVCMGPRFPYANWLADHPLVEARVIWWQAFHQRFDGMLYWGLNIWDRRHNERRIDPSRGQLFDFSFTTGGDYAWLHGDGVLLYPGLNGPIGSIRLANLRDGLEDYEYLATLAQRRGDVAVARRACLPVTGSLTQFTRDPATVLSARRAVAERIEVE